MSRSRVLVGAVAALVLAGVAPSANSPIPAPDAPEPRQTQRLGNNRKRTRSARAKLARWRIEKASRARNLGRRGQRRKR